MSAKEKGQQWGNLNIVGPKFPKVPKGERTKKRKPEFVINISLLLSNEHGRQLDHLDTHTANEHSCVVYIKAKCILRSVALLLGDQNRDIS